MSPWHDLNLSNPRLVPHLEDLPDCELCDAEFMRTPPSYTIDTINEIKADELYLILGEKTVYGLSEWKDIDKLLNLAAPLIGTYHGFNTKKW